MTGDLASVDIATTDNLNNLVTVGKSLLDKPVTRLNSDSGVVELVPKGGTNGEALKRYYYKLHLLSLMKTGFSRHKLFMDVVFKCRFAKQLSDERKLREINYTKGTAQV